MRRSKQTRPSVVQLINISTAREIHDHTVDHSLIKRNGVYEVVWEARELTEYNKFSEAQ